jgi:hypothetical protein
MATIHTELPQDRQGHHGEFVVGQILKEFTNPGLELWFDVNYIAGVTDLDLILLDNQVGFYLIEIKSVNLDSIQEFTMSDFVLKMNQARSHPKSQLLTGSLKLRDYLKRLPGLNDKTKLPFIQSTVLWSEITREEWKHRFSDPSISSFEEFCLFKDDLIGYNTLIDRLQRLWERPLLGTTAPQRARSEHGNTEAFRSALAPSKHKLEIPKSLVNEISRTVKESKKIADKYELGKKHMVSLQGPPGTGKTTILREIGLKNLAAGAKVLHVCFNKVLAADQKREYQVMRKKIDEYGFIDVFDVWALYKDLGHTSGIQSESEVLKNVKAFLESEDGKNFVKYDVILVDESQDLREDFFKVLELISRPTSSWFIAYGKGQETNNFLKDATHPSPWLKNFLAVADANHLKRSFRNSTKAFLLAQAFWENFPNLEDSKLWIKSKLNPESKSDSQFELDLALPQTKNDFEIETLPAGNTRQSFVKHMVLGAIEDSLRAGRGEDLLVAVLAPSSLNPKDGPDSIESSYHLVREVLEDISVHLGLDFHDLVPKDSRRDIPKMGALRLVTLQGIRGLSASHVIIFDLRQLEKWVLQSGGSMKPPLVNLAYIALSRSKASTIIAVENDENSVIEPFLIELLTYSTELAIKQSRNV